MIVGEVYRSPNSCVTEFSSLYSNLLSILETYHIPVVIGSDFNFDLFKTGVDKKSSDFLDMNLSGRFAPCIFKPTRVTKSSCTLIDNIYVRDDHQKFLDSTNCTSAIIIDDISDHFPCLLGVSDFVECDIDEKCYYRRKVTDQKILDVNHVLLHTNWCELLDGDLEYAYEKFNIAINEAINRFIPMKLNRVSGSSTTNPAWYSKSIGKSIKKCKKLYHKFVKNRDIQSETIYKKYRNSLNRIIRYEKKTFFDAKFKKFRANGNVTWSLINSLIKRSCDKSSIINLINLPNRSTITSPSLIADSFNQHFSSVSDRISRQVRPTQCNPESFLKHRSEDELCLNPTNEVEIDKIITDLKPKLSYGIDGISNKLLKQIQSSLRTPLAILCNKSMSEGKFPTQLKTAKVVPLFKSGCRTDMDNYRPISVLPVLSKVFEKIVLRWFKPFMKDKFYINQFGFTENASTIQAGQRFMAELLECYDKGSMLLSVFIY